MAGQQALQGLQPVQTNLQAEGRAVDAISAWQGKRPGVASIAASA